MQHNLKMGDTWTHKCDLCDGILMFAVPKREWNRPHLHELTVASICTGCKRDTAARLVGDGDTYTLTAYGILCGAKLTRVWQRVSAEDAQEFLDQCDEAYAALRNDPEAWKAEVEQRQAWDTTLLDGFPEVNPPAIPDACLTRLQELAGGSAVSDDILTDLRYEIVSLIAQDDISGLCELNYILTPLANALSQRLQKAEVDVWLYQAAEVTVLATMVRMAVNRLRNK